MDVFEAALPEMSTFEGLGGLPEDEVNLPERPVVEGLPEAEVCLLERPVVEALPEAKMFLLAEMFLPERPVVEGLRCILELDGYLLETSTFETLKACVVSLNSMDHYLRPKNSKPWAFCLKLTHVYMLPRCFS